MSYFARVRKMPAPCIYRRAAEDAEEEFYFKKYSDSATRRLWGEITISAIRLLELTQAEDSAFLASYATTVLARAR
jgi:hypothetical protein